MTKSIHTPSQRKVLFSFVKCSPKWKISFSLRCENIQTEKPQRLWVWNRIEGKRWNKVSFHNTQFSEIENQCAGRGYILRWHTHTHTLHLAAHKKTRRTAKCKQHGFMSMKEWWQWWMWQQRWWWWWWTRKATFHAKWNIKQIRWRKTNAWKKFLKQILLLFGDEQECERRIQRPI